MAKPTKTPSGNYRVIVDFGGRRKSATFPTLKAARAGQARMLVELGSTPTALTATIEDILADYLAAAAATVSPAYLYNATNVVDRLPEALASSPANTATVFQIEAAYRKMAADGVGVHSVHRLHGVLSAAFKRAARYSIVAANPMRSVEPPRRPSADVHPPTADQVRTLIAACLRPLHALTYSLAASTGARRGELVGLQWGDIDFESGQISIVRSLAKSPGMSMTVRPTKTGAKGQRTVSVDPATMALLATHRAAHPDGEWVLSPTGGEDPWRPQTVTQEFAIDMRRAGLSGLFRLHDLRHFHATQLLTAGVDVYIVSRRLGHSGTQTTLSTYAHWVPGSDADKAAAEAIARVMRGD